MPATLSGSDAARGTINWQRGQERPEPRPTPPQQKGQAGQVNQRRPQGTINEELLSKENLKERP